MTHYPLVCDPALLAGAESRLGFCPWLDYGWAIRNANVACFSDWSDAFDYCRERNKPTDVRMFGVPDEGRYTLFPNGTAKLRRSNRAVSPIRAERSTLFLEQQHHGGHTR